jgi:hypothetical protein
MAQTSGTITATGTGSAVTLTVDPAGPDSEGVVQISGTYTSPTLVVQMKIIGSAVWTDLHLLDIDTLAEADGSVAVTTDATATYRFSCPGAYQVRAYLSGGTGLTAAVVLLSGATGAFGALAPVVHVASGGSQTFGDVLLTDNSLLKLGTDSDLTVGWDGTDIDVLAAADNTMLTVGASGNAFDLKWFGADANGFFSWDASANDLKFEDSVSVMFGTGAGAGVGNAGDVELRWDATDLDLLAAADDTVFKIGNGTNSFDVWLFGNAASTYVSWDASADSMKFEDNCFLGFGTNTAGPGTKGDINVTWNGTKLLVAQTTVNSAIDFGVSGAGIDVQFYGDTAGSDLLWDQSADALLFADNAKLAIGTGSDIVFAWDATRLNVTQAAVNSEIRWGVDAAGIDQVWYGDTASTNMTWDQSADSLIFTGAARIVWTGTTGQPEMHLTDNLADALSIEISGSTDLLTFTTTNDAESVSPIGLRTRSSTAVAIAGATTLKLSDSGGIFTVSQAAAYDVDLPSPTSGPGCSYFFSVTAPGANNVTITVDGSAATFVGSLVTEGQIVVATGSTLTIASGVAVLGDSIEIRSIATNLYHVRAVSAILNGITVA